MIRIALHIFIPLLIIALSFSCSDQDGGNGDDLSDDFIHLSSYIAISSDQLSEDNFVTGDRIGLFVVPYEEDTPGTIGIDDYVSNLELVFSGSGWNRPNGQSLPWPGTSTIDLYAYYPYDPALTNPDAYVFTVNSDQSTRSRYDESDFLGAMTMGITPRSTVPMVFYHKLSRININIDAGAAGNDPEAEVEVEIYEMLPSATIDFTDGMATVNTGTQRIAVSPLPVESRDEEYSHSFSAIVPPQPITTGTRLLRIGVSGTNYFYRTDRAITLERGSTLTFNIAITQLGISVTVDQINEWLEGGTVEGNVGGSAPRVLDLSEVDWNRSFIYDVYYRNSRIAQVCREYLFINGGTIDAQAVVVYPIGTDGQPNLAAGFVAQVMNRDRNLSTNLYEPNPSNIHGGRAVFNSSTNSLTSYTPGTSPLIQLVRVVSSDEVTAAADNSAIILEVQPRYLTDVDGNNYPQVKIGTQYWTAENAKVEHYRDGTDLQVYWYQDNVANKNLYGGYYIWDTVTDPRGFAPEGWRIPTSEDWTSLYSYLTPNAGGKMKANRLWNNLNNGDNVTGFSGLPAGRRTNTGVYNEFGNYGQWWSQTSANANSAYRLYLDQGSLAITYVTLEKSFTQSVRLIRE